jgi:hypothetical protein
MVLGLRLLASRDTYEWLHLASSDDRWLPSRAGALVARAKARERGDT